MFEKSMSMYMYVSTIQTPQGDSPRHSVYLAIQTDSLGTRNLDCAMECGEARTITHFNKPHCEQARRLIVLLPAISAVFTTPLLYFADELYMAGSWTVGTVLSPSIGGRLEEPAKYYPQRFSDDGIYIWKVGRPTRRSS